MMKVVTTWLKNNIVALVLVLCFIPIYVFSQITGTVFEHWGSTSMTFLNSEYYRWFICFFLHFNFVHIFFNSITLLSIGSLVSPFIGKWKTFFVHLVWDIGGSSLFSYNEFFRTDLWRRLIRRSICTYSCFCGMLSKVSGKVQPKMV